MTGRRLLIFLLFILLSFLLYHNSLTSAFALDDSLLIRGNSTIRELSNFSDLSGPRYAGLFSLALNYAVGGQSVVGYHLVNIFLHSINAFLVYLLLSSLLSYTAFKRDEEGSPGAISVSVAAALIFLAHPVHIEAVTHISGRFSILATLFYLLAIALYLYSRRGALLRRFLSYIGALLATLLAFKSAEISFTLPAMLFLIELGFIKSSGTYRKSLLLLLPFFLLLAIIPLDNLFIGIGIGAQLSPYDYLITEFRVVVTYLSLLVFPVGQVMSYDYPTYDSLTALPVLLSFLFLAGIFLTGTYIFIRARKRARQRHSASITTLFGFGVLWFFLTLSVESSIIPMKEHIAEGRLYLPSVGFVLVAATLFYRSAAYLSAVHAKVRKPVRYFWTLVISATLALSVTTIFRNAL